MILRQFANLNDNGSTVFYTEATCPYYKITFPDQLRVIVRLMEYRCGPIHVLKGFAYSYLLLILVETKGFVNNMLRVNKSISRQK